MADDRVLVVGAGVVGLTAALGLARRGHPVEVLERALGPDDDLRDHDYNWPVLPGLAELGLLDAVVAAGTTVREWQCSVRRTGEHLRFGYESLADDVAHPFCVNLGQDRMVRLLVERLEQHSHASVRWGTEVTAVLPDDSGVTVSARSAGTVLSARGTWLIGADGARSAVRRQLGLGLAGMSWPERLVSTDLQLDLAAHGHLPRDYQLDPTDGAMTVLVDAPDHWRFVRAESRLLPQDTAGQRLDDLLRRVLPGGAGQRPVSPVSSHRIHERAVDRMRVGRTVLIGDAAHLTNPVVGLGMTAGLLDAFALADALSDTIAGNGRADALDDFSGSRLQAFWDDVVPPSSEAKSLVFPSADDPARFEAALQVLREASTDRSVQREFLLRLGGQPVTLTTG